MGSSQQSTPRQSTPRQARKEDITIADTYHHSYSEAEDDEEMFPVGRGELLSAKQDKSQALSQDFATESPGVLRDAGDGHGVDFARMDHEDMMGENPSASECDPSMANGEEEAMDVDGGDIGTPGQDVDQFGGDVDV